MADEKDGINKDDLEDAVRGVLRKARGRPNSAIKQLLAENHDLREDRRTLRAEIKDLTAKVPAKDAVVATEEQSKILAYLKENKVENLEGVQKVFGKVDELQGQLKEHDLAAVRAEAAQLLGFPSATLNDMVKARDLILTVEEETVTENGSKVTKRVPMVSTGKQGEKARPLSDYIEADAAEYKALIGSETDQGTTTTTPTTKRVPGQSSTKKAGDKNGGSGSIVDELLKANKDRAEAPNALRPAKAATA